MLRPTDRTLQFPEAPNQFSIFRNSIIYSSNPSSTPQTGIINNLGIRRSTNQEEENCEHVGQKEKEKVTVDLRVSTAVERKVWSSVTLINREFQCIFPDPTCRSIILKSVVMNRCATAQSTHCAAAHPTYGVSQHI